MEKKLSQNRSGATGMILGKFLPPHLGHKYLIDFALNYVEKLTIIVASIQSEPIPGRLRHQWMTKLFPEADVVHLTDENPQEPHEHPDFWRIWHASIRKMLPEGPDYLFASEDYGFKLSEILGATYIPVDHARSVVPVSGTSIRHEPMKNWRYLPSRVRPYYVKKVCVFGPESTGKTTLTRRLAREFNTVHVDEYARDMLVLKNNEVTAGDIPYIAKGQTASEDAAALQANKVMFCDTDLITTVLWSEVLFNGCPQWIRDEADRRKYDLYLLLDIDTPFVDDPQRFLPDRRKWFLDVCIHALESRNRPYIMINGSWEERFNKAVIAVNKLIES